MKLLINLFISVFLFSFHSKAVTCTSIGSGAWDNPVTWSCGAVPLPGDTIVISIGDIVVLSNNTDLTGAPTVIIINGVLLFDSPSAKLRLDCGSTVTVTATGSIQDSGVGTPSHSITICGALVWEGTDGTVIGVVVFGDPSPLSIELNFFRGDQNNQFINFEWSTASEINNDYFTIEGSIDGEQWESLMNINGSGTTSDENFYSENFDNRVNDFVYFRLKQTDFDGQFDFSDVISVKPNVEDDFKIYPNPLKGQSLKITFSNNNKYSIVIASVAGNKMFVKNEVEARELWIDNLALPSGLYIVSILTNEEVISKRLVVGN